MTNPIRTAFMGFLTLERKGGFGPACRWLRYCLTFLLHLRRYRSKPEYTLAS